MQPSDPSGTPTGAPRIYLDHAATTPMLPPARAAMTAAIGAWANPSSPHGEGRRARALVEDARRRIGDRLGWDRDIIFTSGATEAIAIALRTDVTVLASAVEHDAVLRHVPLSGHIPVDRNGRVDLSALAAMMAGNPGARVAVQQVNSETGVVQPVDAVAGIVHDAGGTLLCDAAQGVARLPLPLAADLIVTSAHKLGGPVGVGALLVRDLALLHPVGGQEQGYRAGTENLPAIMGFAAAVEAMPDARAASPGWVAAAGDWMAAMGARVHAVGGQVLCNGADRSPLIAAVAMPGVSATAQVMHFDAMGFSVSVGSACSSGRMRQSHVLAALGLDDRVARSVIRVSLGITTTADDILAFADAWDGLVRRMA